MSSGTRAEVRDFDGLETQFSDFAYEQGWTDGLPIVAPTPDRVAAMVAASGRAADELLGYVAPLWGELTVERAAVHAVMAGCRPADFPVVVAAAEAVLDEDFNLLGVQPTTNPVGATIIVNGPIAGELGINSGAGCLGPGFRANITIGRSIRLIFLNVGGGRPGVIDRSTQGSPGKLSLCFAENEARSPWEPLHVDRGFEAGDSTVTLYQGSGTFNILDLVSSNAVELLTTIAHSITGIGNNTMLLARGEALVVLCPEHADILARDGFTKADVQRYLWEHSTVRGDHFPAEMRTFVEFWRREEFGGEIKPDTIIPLVRKPEDLVVVVAGGTGPHSCFIPSFGDGRLVTRPVRRADSSAS